VSLADACSQKGRKRSCACSQKGRKRGCLPARDQVLHGYHTSTEVAYASMAFHISAYGRGVGRCGAGWPGRLEPKPAVCALNIRFGALLQDVDAAWGDAGLGDLDDWSRFLEVPDLGFLPDDSGGDWFGTGAGASQPADG